MILILNNSFFICAEVGTRDSGLRILCSSSRNKEQHFFKCLNCPWAQLKFHLYNPNFKLFIFPFTWLLVFPAPAHPSFFSCFSILSNFVYGLAYFFLLCLPKSPLPRPAVTWGKAAPIVLKLGLEVNRQYHRAKV